MFSCIKYKLGGHQDRKHVKKRNNSVKESLLFKNIEKTHDILNDASARRNMQSSKKIISETNVTEKDRRDTDDNIDKDLTVDTDEGWYSRDVSDMSDYLSYQVWNFKNHFFLNFRLLGFSKC